MATKLIKVKFLKHHSKYAYPAGKIGFVTPEAAATLSDGEDPYILIFPDDYEEPVPPAQKIIPESEMIKARMIVPHEGFALGLGKVGLFTPEDALKLLELGCLEILPDDYQEPVQENIVIPESEMIEAIVIKNHPGFVWIAGDQGRFTPKDFDMLSKGGFVAGVKKESALTTKVRNKLKNILKQK